MSGDSIDLEETRAELAQVRAERDALLRGSRCPQCNATEWGEAGRQRARAEAAEADRDVYVHLQEEAREALRSVADRMDDFAFDELNTPLSDGVGDPETGTEYRSRLSVAEAERDDLARWKAEALPVMGGLQDLGKALGVPWGERITGPAAVAAAIALRARAEAAEELAALQNGRAGTAEAERDTLREVNQRMATRIGNHSRRLQEDLDPLFKLLGRVGAILDPDWQPDPAVAGFEWEINAERVRALRAEMAKAVQ